MYSFIRVSLSGLMGVIFLVGCAQFDPALDSSSAQKKSVGSNASESSGNSLRSSESDESQYSSSHSQVSDEPILLALTENHSNIEDFTVTREELDHLIDVCGKARAEQLFLSCSIKENHETVVRALFQIARDGTTEGFVFETIVERNGEVSDWKKDEKLEYYNKIQVEFQKRS